MQLLLKFTREQWVEYSLLIFLVCAVLWRGGKSIDATWVLTGVTAFVVFFSSRKNTEQQVPLLLWSSVVLFCVWTVASYLQSETANYGVDEVLQTGSCTLLFLWAYRFAKSNCEKLDANVSKYVRVLSIATLTACGLGVVIYVFQPVNRFVGSFFDYRFHTDYWPNAWANFLLLAWPIVSYWVFSQYIVRRRDSRVRKYTDVAIRLVILAFVLACLFLSYSRGGLIAFSGQVVLWAGIILIHTKDWRTWKGILRTCLVTFIVSLFLFQLMNVVRTSFHDVLSINQKITFSADEGTSSVSERRQFWSQALALAVDRPLFGWGPYSFRFIQPHVQEEVFATSDHPHNIFLKFAAERGVLSAVLFLFIILSVLLPAANGAVRRSKANIVSIGTVFLLGIAGVLSHSLIDYNMQFVGIAFPFWLFLGFLGGSYGRDSMSYMPHKTARVIEVLITAVLLFVALVEGGYLVASSMGRHAQSRSESRAALRWYERANGEHFRRDLNLSTAEILYESKQYQAAEREIFEYLKWNSQDARAWKRLGEINEAMFEYDDAIRSYETAYEYGKYNDIGILLGLIRSHLSKGEREAVDQRRQEFDELINLYGNAIVQNTHFIALSPNVEEFIELNELMIELYPDDAPFYIVLAAKADDHAQYERGRIDARVPGLLW